MNAPDIKKIAIIDVGSNSVRIKIFCGRKILFKDLITSQLSEGITDGKLAYKSIIRTFEAIDSFVNKAKSEGAKIHAFATAAVRNTSSRQQFQEEFYKRYGFELDVLSGDEEAEVGLFGALEENDGCVLDIGGASTEIAVRQGKKIIYSHSLPLGAVVLTDKFEKNKDDCRKYLNDAFLLYGDIPSSQKYVCIGGTATSLAFIKSGQKTYNSKIVHGTVLTKQFIIKLVDYFYNTDYAVIAEKTNLSLKRARVIHSGAAILLQAMETLKTNEITVSESDNLEGYYYTKTKAKTGNDNNEK